MSKVKIHTNRITITPDPPQNNAYRILERQIDKHFKISSEKSLANLSIKNHPFVLSFASKRKLKDSINTMYCLSKPRTVYRRNGKPIYNFRQAFVTLTLPSQQKHSDTVIKSQCVNQYLTELRQRYNFKNYVWKAELQKNGSIHFHFFFDKFLDYKVHRWLWNRCIEKLGYVSVYQKKFSNLSIQEYANIRRQPVESVKDAFASGVRDRWCNPNSVDVRSIRNDKDLAVYASKYVSKDESGEMIKAPSGKIKRKISISMLVRERAFGRSWSRSYSLAQFQNIVTFDLDEIINEIKEIKKCVEAVKVIIGDWFSVIYFKLQKLPQWFQKWHGHIFKSCANYSLYPIPY